MKGRNDLGHGTRTLQDLDNRHFMHPWEDMGYFGDNERTVLCRGEGIYVYDSDGNRLMDGPGGMWCSQIGYGRQEMAEAISEQVMQLSYFSPFDLSNDIAARLTEKLAELTPGDLNRVFLTTCGSTAVDTALRFVSFRNNYLGLPDRKIVISREDAYHGSTYLSASASGKTRDKNLMDTASHIVVHIGSPNPLGRPEGMSTEAFRDSKVQELEDKILAFGADKVAAFIAEPILASGGVIVPVPGYHRMCLEVCRRHDVLYISDEVVTGFGRLGHWFSSEDVFGIQPDIITCAKGLTSGYLPMGACMISDRLFDDVQGEQAKGSMFSNGFTYSGHPVCAAAALKNIEIIENENLLEHVRDVGPYFQERLRELYDIPIVHEVRGKGLMACVECQLSEAGSSLEADYRMGSRIDKHTQELGLIVRPLINMCVMSPPLIIAREQIDSMVDILRRGIEMALEDVTREGLYKG